MEVLKNKDIEDGKRIADIFATLSEENKNMAIVYLSALRDKEIADSSKKEVNQMNLYDVALFFSIAAIILNIITFFLNRK